MTLLAYADMHFVKTSVFFRFSLKNKAHKFFNLDVRPYMVKQGRNIRNSGQKTRQANNKD